MNENNNNLPSMGKNGIDHTAHEDSLLSNGSRIASFLASSQNRLARAAGNSVNAGPPDIDGEAGGPPDLDGEAGGPPDLDGEAGGPPDLDGEAGGPPDLDGEPDGPPDLDEEAELAERTEPDESENADAAPVPAKAVSTDAPKPNAPSPTAPAPKKRKTSTRGSKNRKKSESAKKKDAADSPAFKPKHDGVGRLKVRPHDESHISTYPSNTERRQVSAAMRLYASESVDAGITEKAPALTDYSRKILVNAIGNRGIYVCDKCGLELANISGPSHKTFDKENFKCPCPRCTGHMKPAPLKLQYYAWDRSQEMELDPAVTKEIVEFNRLFFPQYVSEDGILIDPPKPSKSSVPKKSAQAADSVSDDSICDPDAPIL